MRILIAEDDATLADRLTRSLRRTGYTVGQVSGEATAGAALSAQTVQTYDLLILDVSLPHMSGLEALERLCSHGTMLLVLILTTADSMEERVGGLDLGTDDYMAKPFTLSELEMRIRALVRRGTGGSAMLVRHGPLIFDQVGRIAYIHSQVVKLPAREIGLLEILPARVGRLVSREQLVDRLCDWGEEVGDNTIEIYIHRLHKKIEVEGVRIATVRGFGYCLECVTTPTTTATAHG